MTVLSWRGLLRHGGNALIEVICAIVARQTAESAKPPAERPSPVLHVGVTALIYELLDAHYDTAQLARGLTDDERWEHHLEYLQVLQRVGRETLAVTSRELLR